MRMKQWVIAATLVCGSLTASAQENSGQFTLATMNVDGLPQKLLVVKLNPDGPGDAGSARIGKYIVKKGYDLVMMQEDFNYHGVLKVLLEDDYKMDEWSGDIGIEGRKIDFLHLQNHRFECDGLMACWKNDLQVSPAGRTAWNANFGKFSHANDEIVTKGFRRYEVTLRDGSRVVVYNMHMDATLDEDEAEEKGGPDREARIAQWTQLKDDVLQQLDTRPVIITGDLNSFYGRDNVKAVFIDPINESGRATASDVWVELEKQGVYPTTTSTEELSNVRDGESLDKIIYINPATGTKIKPVKWSIDTTDYIYDGKPLGDHYPVVATFQVTDRVSTGIVEVDAETTDSGIYYNMNGQQVTTPRNGVFIQNGSKTVIR